MVRIIISLILEQKSNGRVAFSTPGSEQDMSRKQDSGPLLPPHLMISGTSREMKAKNKNPPHITK